jgi:NADPH:quinone reductase-like Zn-dependent oxidoreductase
MKAAIFNGPGTVEVGERPDPIVQEPTDAVVRVVLGCVCGSDLWYYRGESPHAAGSIGHEFIGIVEQTGADVHSVREGDLVVAPFIYSDMTCPHDLRPPHPRSGRRRQPAHHRPPSVPRAPSPNPGARKTATAIRHPEKWQVEG